jgi:pyruvate dehydrogenase E2 component (dihydrolipoamide acetyltransferase)
MHEFRMPSLGADMEDGTLVEWNMKPGQTVKRGDIVAVVETQKGAVDVEIWEDGIVDRLLVEPGTRVPVGEPIAMLRGEGEQAAAPKAIVPAAPEAIVPAKKVAPAAAPAAATPAREEIRAKASPAARRRAAELGVDLSRVAASSADGVVSLADVERAAQAAPAMTVEPAPGKAASPDRASAMRAAIGAAMAKSKREIPHYYLGATVDVTGALAWLEQENAGRPVAERVLFAAVLLRAAALALAEVPELNGHWTGGRLQVAPAVHLGVGIALRGGGLVAPAIHDADKKDVVQIMRALADLITRARSGGLRSSELTDATITVTNLGEQGVEEVYGVIYPPQVALVGFGKVLARPWVHEGSIGVRQTLRVTLSADHRASVGHRGALYLAALERRLLEPEELS